MTTTTSTTAPPRRLDERRFDIILTVVLLGAGVWYGLTMLSYPSSAGRVPAFVAAIMVGAAVVQVVIQLLHLRRRPTAAPADAAAAAPSSGEEDAAPRAAQEPEIDSYESLIALGAGRRGKFLAIVAFSAAFYVGFLLVGFVLTTAALITAIMLFSRERVWAALLGGVIGGAAAYALVVGVMNLPPVSGMLVG